MKMSLEKTSLAEDVFKVLLKCRTEDEKYQTNVIFQIQASSQSHSQSAIPWKFESVPMTEERQEANVANDKATALIIEEKPNIVDSSFLPDEDDDGESDSNWCQIWGNSWRQFTAILPGVIFLLSIGPQFSLCISELDLTASNPTLFTDSSEENVNITAEMYYQTVTTVTFIWFPIIVAWYAGAILGSYVGAIFVSSYKKSTIYFLSGLLLAASGSLFLMGPYGELVARILFGLAYGLVHLTVIVHISEIAAKEMRGVIVRRIAYLNTISTVISSLLIHKSGYTTEMLNKNMASQLIILAIIGLILTPFLTHETVPYLLLHGKESQASRKLTKLRSERQPSRNTRKIFEQIQLAVNEDKINKTSIFDSANLKPLFVITHARLLDLLLCSVPVTLLLMQLYKETPLEKTRVPDSLLARHELIRALTGTLVLFISPLIGGPRTVLFVVSALSYVINWRIGANIFLVQNSMLNVQSTAIILVIAFVSVSVNTLQSLHTTQAFSISRKPWSIAFVAQIEHLAHIGLIAIYYYVKRSDMVFWTLLSGGTFFIPVLLLVMLPKSTKLSLRDAWK